MQGLATAPAHEAIFNSLPSDDREFLERFGDKVRLERSGGTILVIFQEYDLGAAYNPRIVELMIQLPPGYPNSALDMYWTNPSVRLHTGAMPAQCGHHVTIGEVQWQRWSRHPTKGWRSGIDSLKTFYASVRRDVSRGI